MCGSHLISIAGCCSKVWGSEQGPQLCGNWRRLEWWGRGRYGHRDSCGNARPCVHQPVDCYPPRFSNYHILPHWPHPGFINLVMVKIFPVKPWKCSLEDCLKWPQIFPSHGEMKSISAPLELVGHATCFGQQDVSEYDSSPLEKCLYIEVCPFLLLLEQHCMGRHIDNPNE